MNNESIGPAFELVYRLQLSSGDGPDGLTHDAIGLIALMRGDPEFCELERSWAEHHWRTGGREESEKWIQLLVAAARYFSDLIEGEVPILAPREVVDASVGFDRTGDKDALLIGRSVSRAIRSQMRQATEGARHNRRHQGRAGGSPGDAGRFTCLAKWQVNVPLTRNNDLPYNFSRPPSVMHPATDSNTESLLAEFERLLDGVVNNAAPAHSRWLTTEQVAARLALNRATVEREFRSEEIDGDKTADNQWRTTEQRLRNSSHLKKKARVRYA